MADLRRVVAGAPEAVRRVFETLLRDGRMRVLPDAEQGYRVEAVFVLSPNGKLRGVPSEDAAQQVLVAGERYAALSRLAVPVSL